MELPFLPEGVSTELRHREIQDIRGFYTAGRHVQRAGADSRNAIGQPFGVGAVSCYYTPALVPKRKLGGPY